MRRSLAILIIVLGLLASTGCVEVKPWQREVLRIIRNIAQYFYPQQQTKVMNEGCACFVHYHIVNALRDKGLLTDGAMIEMPSDESAV